MRIFIPITKVDEAKREVWGTLTQDTPDRDDEILDYPTSKGYFERWSGSFAEQTGGKSLGNLRSMHQKIASGKLISIDFNDADKRIDIGAKVVDETEWQKVVEGVYTGFSAAGRVIGKKWKDKATGCMRYTADPYEASLVDFPAVPTATFSVVKAAGAATETRHFKTTKKAADTPAKYGDAEFADETQKRIAIHTNAHTHVALAYWSKAAHRAQYDDAEQARISRAIRGAARSFGIAGVTEKAMLGGEFAKGMYDVQELARFVECLSWLQTSTAQERTFEGDESKVPDRLRDCIADLGAILQEMLGEELRELLDRLGYGEGGTFATSTKAAGETDTMEQKDFDALKTQVASQQTLLESIAKAVGVKAGEAATPLVAKAAGADAPVVVQLPEDFTKVANGLKDLTTRVEAAETANKELVTKLAAAETARDTFQKNAEDLAAAGEALLAGATGTKGVLRAVGKSEDVAAPAAVVEKVAVVEEPKTARDAFKKAFLSPTIPGMAPAARAGAAQ